MAYSCGMVYHPISLYPWHPSFSWVPIPLCFSEEVGQVVPNQSDGFSSSHQSRSHFEDEPQSPCRNLYATNLPPSYNQEKVRALFQPFGSIFSVVHFKSRRAACVQFHVAEDAVRALDALDGLSIGKHWFISVKYANRTYTPHRRASAPKSHSGSDSDSVGHSGPATSDVDSIDLDEEEEQEPTESARECGFRLPREDWAPPSEDAIEEANFLLEAAMVGTVLNERLLEAFRVEERGSKVDQGYPDSRRDTYGPPPLSTRP